MDIHLRCSKFMFKSNFIRFAECRIVVNLLMLFLLSSCSVFDGLFSNLESKNQPIYVVVTATAPSTQTPVLEDQIAHLTYTPLPTYTSAPTYTPQLTFTPMPTYSIPPTVQPIDLYPTFSPSDQGCCTLRIRNKGKVTYWIGMKLPYGGNYIKPLWYVEFYLPKTMWVRIWWCRYHNYDKDRLYNCDHRDVYVDENFQEISIP